MATNKLNVVYMEEAVEFIKAQPKAASDKILDNIHLLRKENAM